jgi:hypothetical protein
LKLPRYQGTQVNPDSPLDSNQTGRLAGCGKSLPPQDAAIGDHQKPRLFGVSLKWKKAMDGFFQVQLGTAVDGDDLPSDKRGSTAREVVDGGDHVVRCAKPPECGASDDATTVFI